MTLVDKAEFIGMVKDGAIEAYKKSHILPSLTIAQAALESGWGRAAPGFNLFGIKWSQDCGYAKQILNTTEYINGRPVTVNAAFRKYKNYDESILDHTKLLSISRYKPVRDAANYKEACFRVQQCGYATDPNYAVMLIKIIEQNNLFRYDA